MGFGHSLLDSQRSRGGKEYGMGLPKTRRNFTAAGGGSGQLYALQVLEQAGLGAISRLPVTLRIVLESVA